MSLWGAKDAVSNTATVWAAAFKKDGNTSNRAALYGNTTVNSFVKNKKVGVFAVTAAEMGKQFNKKVLTVSVGANAGLNYANGDIVRLNTGIASVNAEFTVTTGAANTSVASLTVSNAGEFTTSPTLSSGATNNKTVANASANGLLLTVTLGTKYEGQRVSHTGWNVRKEGTGGRAGRVNYECLVAGGITGASNTNSTTLLG